jgi:hypothetical protein
MLLSALTANLQTSYADIQAQIEALQEQQRLIQAQLQRVGSVESKMESAAALVAEAIAEIREVCPEELSAYQEVISGLFCDAPIAQIQAGADIAPESQPEENPVPPDSEEPALEVESMVVVEETDDTPNEDVVVVSHQASARSLHQQPTKPLQWLATKRGIDFSQMKRHQIATALVGQVTDAELQEAVEQTTVAS